MSFKLYGAAADYFVSAEREVLCEGPARAAKSFSILAKAWWTATNYPGCRQLFAMQTREALTRTILPDWEEKILGYGHPAIGRAMRTNRTCYWFTNGSYVDLLGCVDIDRILSAEYDRIYVFQTEQITLKSWETLISRLSGRNTSYNQITADVNPGPIKLWLNKRGNEIRCLNLRCGALVSAEGPCPRCGAGEAKKVMQRLLYRHQDNPLLYDHARRDWSEFGRDYLTNTLGKLTGPRRQRLLLSQWVSEEGMILDEFDPAVHMISASALEKQADGTFSLKVKGWKDCVTLEWFAAGVDWGFSPNPGVLQVWGYDREGRRFRVAEVYRTKWQLDQWAEVAENLWREFDIRYFACDPSRNDEIATFNTRLGRRLGRTAPAIAIGADNTLRRQKPDLAGIDLMRWGLRDPKGVVRTFLLREALRYGIDAELEAQHRPTCTEDEIPEWIYDKRSGDEEPLAKPDDDCDDHGLDAWRYECGEGWGKRLAKLRAGTEYPEGSYGKILKHAERWARARKKG